MRSIRTLLIIAGLVLAGSCGGNGSSPSAPSAPSTPTPPAPPSTYTLAGTVTETAPTATKTLSGVTVTFIDGSNQGKSGTTDGNGSYQITGVATGGFSVSASAPGYVSLAKPVTINSNTTLAFQLDPVPQILSTTRNESVSGGDGCVGGPSTYGDGCKQWTLDVHNAGGISSVLTWQDRDTWLWLSLYRMSDGAELAESSQSRTQGLRQEISVNVPGHQQYLIRVRYALGARVTPFTIVVTRPN